MRVLFIGDAHLDNQSPVSRLDDFKTTTIVKLRSILQLANDNNITTCIFTGDMFDKYSVPLSYLVDVIEVLREFKSSGVDVYSLIGNHDLPYNNMQYFKSTPLSLLYKSGLVKPFSMDNPIELDNDFKVYGINFTEMGDIVKPVDAVTNVLVMHYASENTVPGESINLKDLSKFKIVVSGHDHMPYDIINNDTTILIRPGALIRRTKESYNLSRDIYTYMIDTNNYKILKLKLPNVKPAEEVFRYGAFDEGELNVYSNDYNDIFNDKYFDNETQDIFSIVNSLPITISQETKEIIKKHLKAIGLKETS